MRLAIVRTIFAKECREMLRDRRSLAIMFGIPLLLYPLLTVLVASIGLAKTKEFTEHPVQVAVVGSADAPKLMDILKDNGFVLVKSNRPAEDLASGTLDCVIEIPLGAERDALAGKANPVTVRVDRSRTVTPTTERKLDRLFSAYEKWVIEQRLAARGVASSVLTPLKYQTQDIATGDQRFGKILSFTMPVLLLVTGMLGAFFPALNATTTERELGTLETLLVTPAGRMELLLAKGSFVLLCGLTTAALNMLSMSLVLWRSLSVIEKAGGSLSIRPAALALTYLASVPTLMTFAVLVLIMGLIARNFREANALATPVMLLPMASMIVAIAEPRLSPGLLVTPVANTTMIIREVLTGRVTAGAFVLAFVSSCVYAGLLLSLASRVFTSEQLVNPSWEPVSLAGLKRIKGSAARRRLPATDEAIALVAISLLLTFYVTPSLTERGLLINLTITEIFLVAAPALLLGWVRRYRWAETFWWRWPGAGMLAAGVMIGVGIAPWSQLLFSLQCKVWAPSPEYLKMTTELFVGPLTRIPVLFPVIAGVLAGVCEELLYRGPVQKGLLRRLPPWIAVVLTAVLFAGAHLDVYGFAVRAGIGVVLGWLVLRTGSIFPAMAAHGVYDATQLGLMAYAVKTTGPQKVLESATATQAIEWQPLYLAIGALLLGAWGILRRSAGRSVAFAGSNAEAR